MGVAIWLTWRKSFSTPRTTLSLLGAEVVGGSWGGSGRRGFTCTAALPHLASAAYKASAELD